MPNIPSTPTGSPSTVVYPPEHIRDVAAALLAQAGSAQSEHDTAWRQFQSYVYQDCMPDLQQTMLDCVQPYSERLRTSYDWLASLAGALFQVADAIEQAEGQISQTFTAEPTHGRIP